jgi:hypothetical protein
MFSVIRPLDFSSLVDFNLGNGRWSEVMNYVLRIAFFTSIAVVMFSNSAAADFWARVDRPWRNEELDKAIAFCRMQPSLSPSTDMFYDTLMGRQIQTCMHALGWISVAR